MDRGPGCFLGLLFSLILASPVAAQTDPWIGQKFMPKDGCKAMYGDEELDFRVLPQPFNVYDVNGEWLWTGWAWVTKSDVVPLDQAAAYYTEFIGKNPTSAWAYNSRGNAWLEKNELDNALEDYTEAIRVDPQSARAFISRGDLWSKKQEFDNALKDFTEAIRLDPKSKLAYNDRGVAWNGKKEFDNALKDCTQAIRLDPRFFGAYNNRGIAWSGKKEFDNALKDFTEAIRINPQFATSYVNRGMAWTDTKEYNNALKDYTEAIRLDPHFAWAYNCRALLRAAATDRRYRDGKLALADATRACELAKWKVASCIGTLAAAYAENGDFAEAVKWQTKADQMYSDADRAEWAFLLDLYKSGKPYRHEPKAK